MVNILPDGSVVGMILSHAEYHFIKSRSISIDKHFPNNWAVFGQFFVEGEETKSSKAFDNKVELYNSIKPIKFNLNKDNIDDLFAKEVVVLGKRLENRVTFLEKINNRYLAIVEDSKVNSVIIENVTKDFYTMSCSTEKPYLDEHIYATLKSIREKKYKNFYKVKYKNNGVNMLEDVRKGKFYLAYGIENDNLLIVSENGGLSKLPILVNGKVAFEVIEDDDNLSLSKIIENYEKIGG